MAASGAGSERAFGRRSDETSVGSAAPALTVGFIVVAGLMSAPPSLAALGIVRDTFGVACRYSTAGEGAGRFYSSSPGRFAAVVVALAIPVLAVAAIAVAAGRRSPHVLLGLAAGAAVVLAAIAWRVLGAGTAHPRLGPLRPDPSATTVSLVAAAVALVLVAVGWVARPLRVLVLAAAIAAIVIAAAAAQPLVLHPASVAIIAAAAALVHQRSAETGDLVPSSESAADLN